MSKQTSSILSEHFFKLINQLHHQSFPFVLSQGASELAASCRGRNARHRFPVGTLNDSSGVQFPYWIRNFYTLSAHPVSGIGEASNQSTPVVSFASILTKHLTAFIHIHQLHPTSSILSEHFFKLINQLHHQSFPFVLSASRRGTTARHRFSVGTLNDSSGETQPRLAPNPGTNTHWPIDPSHSRALRA